MKINTKRLTLHTSKAEGKIPHVYLAGKIRKNCWRHRLVSGLRDHSWGDGVLPQSQFVYIGPFFVACDHGCFHHNNSHGGIASRQDNLCPGRGAKAEFDNPHAEVVNLCLGALVKADLIFCYIDSPDCYGTLTEIGYGHALGIPTVIAFAPEIATAAKNDFWFACTKARQVLFDIEPYRLKDYLMNAIGRYV